MFQQYLVTTGIHLSYRLLDLDLIWFSYSKEVISVHPLVNNLLGHDLVPAQIPSVGYLKDSPPY
jgi:hypothetical protein